MFSLHELHARASLEASVARDGIEKTYSAIDAVRQALWCTDKNCAHRIEIPIFCQMWGHVPVEQLWMLTQLIGLVGSGRVRRIALPVDATPAPDREAVVNLAALEAALDPTEFSIDVWSSSGGVEGDGVIRWQVSLEVMSQTEALAGESPSATLEPGSATLEIGYTHASRTFWHLWTHGAVWRWPYGSSRLWLLANVGSSDDGNWIEPLSRETMEKVAASLLA